MWTTLLLALLLALAEAVPQAHRRALGVLEVEMQPIAGVTGSDSFAKCARVDDLTPLSYSVKLAPQFDAIKAVMESTSGTCDTFSKDFCKKFAMGKTANVPVDTCIMSTIHAFLADCDAKRADTSDESTRCNALDLGAVRTQSNLPLRLISGHILTDFL